VPRANFLTSLPLALLTVSVTAVAVGLSLSVMRYLSLTAWPFLPLAALPAVLGPVVSICTVHVPLALALPALSRAWYW